MKIRTCSTLGLLLVSSAAFAWQPLTYPIRSQSPYQRSVDTATCYAEANKTKVDIKRESQIPPRTPPAKSGATGVPSKPPLPSSSFSAAPMTPGIPGAASDVAATTAMASAPAASAAPAKGASHVKSASAAVAGSAAMAATAPMSPSASGVPATSDAMLAASQADAASGLKLPPLPDPEPPMARYWAAYTSCMQARGYALTQ